MAKRKNLSKRARFEVFKRDGFICQYCGRTPPTVMLHADHIIAVVNGGGDTEDNLITSCADCNLGKSDIPLGSVLQSRQVSLERQVELAEQTEAYNAFLLEQRQKQYQAIDRLGRYWFNQFEKNEDEYVFGPDRIRSVQTFLKQLTEAELFDAIDIAFSRMPVYGKYDLKAWRYFCGICWKWIRGEDRPR